MHGTFNPQRIKSTLLLLDAAVDYTYQTKRKLLLVVGRCSLTKVDAAKQLIDKNTGSSTNRRRLPVTNLPQFAPANLEELPHEHSHIPP
jgi:hypothetical protein